MLIKRKGRECALQVMYEIETLTKGNFLFSINKNLINQSIKKLFTYFNAPLNVFQQVSFLVIGTITNIKKIDNSIKKYSFKWKIERLSKIDRNILRIASYELFLSSKMPKAVILNEAIEISKKFGDTKSSSFVNGVLNAISIYARNK